LTWLSLIYIYNIIIRISWLSSNWSSICKYSALLIACEWRSMIDCRWWNRNSRPLIVEPLNFSVAYKKTIDVFVLQLIKPQVRVLHYLSCKLSLTKDKTRSIENSVYLLSHNPCPFESRPIYSVSLRLLEWEYWRHILLHDEFASVSKSRF